MKYYGSELEIIATFLVVVLAIFFGLNGWFSVIFFGLFAIDKMLGE